MSVYVDQMTEVEASAEIARLNAETERLHAETVRLQAETRRLNAEVPNLSAETGKLSAEERNLLLEAWFYPFVAVTGVVAATLGLQKLAGLLK